MKLKTITIGNYKNVAETTLNLDKMIAIVSTNNYGKTNLLEAIRFGFSFIQASANTRTVMMSCAKCIPLTRTLAGKDFIFSVEFDAPELCEYRYVKYSYRFSWMNDIDGGATLTDEKIEMRDKESVRYTSYLKRKEGLYRAGKGVTGHRKILLAKNVLAIDALSSVSNLGISNVIFQIKNLSCRMCRTLELDQSFRISPVEFDTGSSVSTSFGDEDIPKALSVLMEESPQKYQLFLETIYDLFPEFKNIELQVYMPKEKEQPEVHAYTISKKNGEEVVEKETDTIPYHIKDEWYRLAIENKYLNQPISMELMSNGTKRIIWLIANAIFASCYGTNLIGVDEIESSIHPKMIRSLLEALDYISEDTSLIVTSHSPYLIQYLKPEAIYVGVPNDEGVAIFKRIAHKKLKSLIKTTRELKTSIGEYLFELMAGDEDSASILSAYLED